MKRKGRVIKKRKGCVSGVSPYRIRKTGFSLSRGKEDAVLTLEKIRAELEDVRLYYLRRETFDKMVSLSGKNAVTEKAERYNEVMKDASAKLMLVFFSLYVENKTQKALAMELGYTPEYIYVLNGQLLAYLQRKLSAE